MVSWIKRLRTNLYGTTRPIRTHRLATTRLRTEQLEGRWMPAVDITSFSVAAGTVTFTGDQNGSTTDDLYLSEVNVGGEVRLSHNLEGAGGTGVYADSTDVDPTAGVAHLVLGTGTTPLISVNLVSTDDVLTLDPAWTFTHLVAFDGGSGNDMLFGADSAANYTISGSGSGNINGTSAFTFAGLENLNAGLGSDTLTGQDATSTWTFTDTTTYNNGTVNVNLIGFEVYQGGTVADTFDLTGDGFLGSVNGTMNGGAGNDTFAFHDFAQLAGTIDGETGTDTLTYADYDISVVVALTGSSAEGMSGVESSVPNGFSNVDVLVGSINGDQLTGLDAASTWALGATATNTDGVGTATFSAFEVLQGGTAVDTFSVTVNSTADLRGGASGDSFVFANGVTLTGTLDGETGTDILNLSAYSTARTVTLTGSDTEGYIGTDGVSSGFSNLDSVVGGSGSDKLVGENVASAWNLDGTPTYNDGGSADFTFSGIEALQGGTNVDTFTVSANTTENLLGGAGEDLFLFSTSGAVLTGSINGETDSDTLSYVGNSANASIVLTSAGNDGFTGTATGASAGFSNVDSLTGGSGSDTLTGENVFSTWNLDAVKSYSNGAQSISFSAIETMQGGSDIDAFAINVNSTANLRGGGDNDSFDFTDGVTLTGTVTGEAGYDTLNYAAYTTSVTINLAAKFATGVSGYSLMENIVGGSQTDSIIGTNTANVWSIASDNAGAVSSTLGDMDFSSFGNLLGGGSTDSFGFSDGAGISGSVNGGAGTDTISMAGSTSAVTFNISTNNGGSVTSGLVTYTFAGMENLTGSSNNDTFTLANAKTISGTLNGGGGSDTLNYGAFTTAVRVNLAQDAAANVKGGASGGALNFENIIGGSGNDILIGNSAVNTLTGNGGNDILVGNAGNDILVGNAGRDILLGGNDADTMDGGTEDDLLIGGRTSYDNNLTALNNMMAEWGRTDATYAVRIAHLNGSLVAGNRNGTAVLNASNVFADSANDSITGGAGVDWFLSLASDIIIDLNTGGTETSTAL